MAEAEGITIGTVIVDDDVAVKDSTWTVGRRGVAGNFFVIKAIGAASEKGAELDDLVALGERVNSVTRTMGMALTSCTPPAKGSPLFELGDDEMEMGVGIHGEPGRRREKLADANAIVDELVEATASDLPFSKGDNVALMINGLGGTPISELYLLYGRAHDQLLVARDQRRPQLRRRVLHVARHGGLLGDAGEARRRAHLAARGTGGGRRSHLLTTGLTPTRPRHRETPVTRPSCVGRESAARWQQTLLFEDLDRHDVAVRRGAALRVRPASNASTGSNSGAVPDPPRDAVEPDDDGRSYRGRRGPPRHRSAEVVLLFRCRRSAPVHRSAGSGSSITHEP